MHLFLQLSYRSCVFTSVTASLLPDEVVHFLSSFGYLSTRVTQVSIIVVNLVIFIGLFIESFNLRNLVRVRLAPYGSFYLLEVLLSVAGYLL